MEKHSMSEQHKNNPLHGIKLQQILEELVKDIGWDELARRVDVRCFKFDPTINSSLKFLRKTPWARTKVEEIYISMLDK